MAYITCKHCGCQMSDKSEACPVCGTSVAEDTTQKEDTTTESNDNQQESVSSAPKAKNKKTFMWIAIVLAAVIAITTTTIIIVHDNNEKQAVEQLRTQHPMAVDQVEKEKKKIEEKIINEDNIISENTKNSYGLDDEVDDVYFNGAAEDEASLNLNNITYDDYCNSRFGFCVSYPAFFKRKYEAYSQDGCEFLFGKNYSLKVYGMYNVMEETVNELFEDCKSRTDTYTASKDNWFVVSGINEQGNVYYKKTILKNDVEFTVELIYPQDRKSEYNAVLKKVIDSFQIMNNEDEDRSQYVVIDGSGLRLRLGPSTNADTFKWLDGTNRHPKVGEKFTYLGESGDFYKIDFNGNELWVSKQYTHIVY